jgi:hypothetical protein
LNSPYTTLGLPPDGVAWAAFGAAFALLSGLCGPVRRALGLTLKPRILVPAFAVGAVLLSLGYIAYYLRGGPRIIDATSYFLQARAMAHGYFAFPVAAPYGSFNGRFLVASQPHSLSVIFPPGYAAVLALGFLARAPLCVGPLLGGLIVLVTYGLARELSGRQDVACVAAALSLLCAALRYHTADTMSHGLCALLLCVGAWTALRGKRWDAPLAGLSLGWLCATRPVSGAVGVVLALCLLERTPRRLLCFVLGLAPGVLLLLLYQRAATGHFFDSTQLEYYALADGPAGCFRYGFGRGIGCLHEHGEFVRARLATGYGLREAAGVTLRRLALHSIDIANAAPLSALCVAGAWLSRAERGVTAIFLACLVFMLAYAPFYFDGSYPGGGARLFSDLLPLEHVLLACALVRLECYVVALPFSLLGFACHASFAHRALAERDGGRPMFESEVLKRAAVDHGLIFVDTDHGFNLGHEPGQLDARKQIVVARYQHDAHDWLLWNQLGRPASQRYVLSATAGAAHAELVPYTPASSPLRFESEAEWPPLAVQGGWVEPDFFPCASGGRGLRLRPATRDTGMALEWEQAVPSSQPEPVRLGWVRAAGPKANLRLTLGEQVRVAEISAGPAACVVLEMGSLELSGEAVRARLEISSPGFLDYIEVGSRAEP